MANSREEGLHVAIVGAGIGGLAFAMALHNKGVSFTLYEEANEYSAVGAGIGLGPNGMRAMDMIEPAFREKYEAICVGNKSAESQHVFFEGLLLEEGLGLTEKWYGQSSWGHPDYVRKSAHRKALLDIMTSFIPMNNVQFDKRLEDVQQCSDKVILTFADGKTADASILVGSDGIQSTVRAHILRHLYPDQVEPVYADSYCYRGVIPIAEAQEILGSHTDTAKFYFGDRRSCVAYRISEGREFNFLLCVADASKPWRAGHTVTEKVTHEQMMADFQDRGIDERFLRLLSKASPIRWGFFHHLHTPTYYRGRAVLVGDSAHASLPFQAAGAAQGVEDALVLSELMLKLARGSCDNGNSETQISAALGAYDAVRRPRAQGQLSRAAEVGQMIHFQHQEVGSDMTRILGKLQNESFFDQLWFHDLKKDLQLASQKMDECLQC